MSKRLTLLAMSVALVALVIPTAAQAAEVTNSFGEDATEISAESENTVINTAAGAITCDTVILVVSGGSGHYHGAGIAVGGATFPHKGECITHSGFHVFVTATTGTVDFINRLLFLTYTYELTTPLGALKCSFTAGGAAVSYAATSDELSVSGTMTGSGGGCPTSGSISGDFTATSGGEPVVIH